MTETKGGVRQFVVRVKITKILRETMTKIVISKTSVMMIALIVAVVMTLMTIKDQV